MKSLGNFAKGCCFERLTINHLASTLQTDLALIEHPNHACEMPAFGGIADIAGTSEDVRL
jgi:hypothetical protein